MHRLRGRDVPSFHNVMIEKETIIQIAQEHLATTDLTLVKVSNNKENNIKVFISRVGGSVCIDDCVELSRFIESRLDRDREDFSLMVSSAGI